VTTIETDAKVVAIETLRDPEHAEFLWVRIETDTGVVGLGETMPKPLAVEAAVHDRLAPLLLGRPISPERFWAESFQSISYAGYGGAEMRALSAVDIALWDALGRITGVPVHTLLGGPVRDRVRVYNTCVGYGAYPDRERFFDDPAGLARDLVAEGYGAVKMAPFDDYSVASLGQHFDSADLAEGVARIAAMRDAVGDAIEIAIEGHSCWNLPSAIRIAKALEPYRPLWLEDILQARSPVAWAQLREATTIPICGSERVFTRFDAINYLQVGAWDYVNQDVAWTGGITEFRKVAALAETFELPVVPHNCHGPVAAAATMAVSAAVSNIAWTETVRSFERGIHPDIAVGGPTTDRGYVIPSESPGLGIELLDSFLSRCLTRRTTVEMVGRAGGWALGDPWANGVDDGM
jgi:L-alanine-DL-glutamate epimerase-like enolase superfamily enzyme